MKKYVLSLFVLISVNIFSQESGWIWQNPKPQGNTLNSIQFINENTGFIVGEAGVVIKTTNGGANWIYITTPLHSNNYAIQFLNSNTGYIAGKGVVKTTNGGLTWEQKLDIDFYFSSISFINAETGFLTGYTGAMGVIYKTTNGGSSFQVYNIHNMLQGICFLNVNTGYVTGLGTVYKTTNGGKVWDTLKTSISANALSIYFLNDNTGYISSSAGKINKTTNGGINWNITETNTNRVNNIVFTDQLTGLGACSEGKIIKSTNGGSSWEIINFGVPEQFRNIYFITSSTYIVVGDNGIIYKTNNSGLNWMKLNTAFTFSEINSGKFVNQNTGYFFAAGELIHTTTQGKIWTVTAISTPTPMLGGYVYSSNLMFVYGYHYCLKSTNAGVSWLSTYIQPNNEIYCAHFRNANTGYLGAILNTILKTTNGGTNWVIYKPSGPISTFAIYDIDFANDSIGVCCGSSGWIARTTNYGKTWIGDYLVYGPSYTDVEFVNDNTGFICGSSMIFKTTNAGANWQQIIIPFTVPFTSMEFFNESTGIVSGHLGSVYKTTNGGNKWYQLRSNCNQNICKMDFVDTLTGFIFGRNGTIMKTTDGGGQFVGLTEQENISPVKFSLSQNYPNPFNPVTNIRFEIPKSGDVKITIFDLLGREITTLVNQPMQAGSYIVDWDASNYPSGVYFYKLETENFTESKKMVLLK